MSAHNSQNSLKNTVLLSLGALGVVYGDIGTSPLYAIREIFFSHAHLEQTPENIFGSISLVIWAITLIVSIKYVVMVLRADQQGEGGVFALYSLLKKMTSPAILVTITLLVLAAGLLFGDGIITPAISVLSSIEGLGMVTHAFDPYIIPITIGILTGLFFIQKGGTHKIGAFFGPIVLVWFFAIATLGVSHLARSPEILKALNPVYAIQFVSHIPLHTLFAVLGSVMLVVTGGEAMYADMGHFGRKPIRASWFFVTYPALILNYLGQGGYLLSHPHLEHVNLFFSMVPQQFLVPMVILATLATIIASQALITGAFSLASQAVSLGLLPFLKTVQTNKEHQGQIYVPAINWLLYVGCISLVIAFGSSSALASAYGLAVAGVMVITTLAMFSIAKYYWNWKNWQIAAIFIPFTFIDVTFLVANSFKVFEGGYVPLAIGIAMLFVMLSWQWGFSKLLAIYQTLSTKTIEDIVKVKKSSKSQIPKSVIVLASEPIDSLKSMVPAAKSLFIERYGLLPKDIIFLSMENDSLAHVDVSEKFKVKTFYQDKQKGSISSIVVRSGFMDSLALEEILEEIAKDHLVHISEKPEHWLVHEIKPLLVEPKQTSLLKKASFSVFKWLYSSTEILERYDGLGSKVQLTLEVVPVNVNRSDI